MKPNIRWTKWASIAICAGAAWVFLRYAAAAVFAALLPFLLSAALAVSVAPLARKLSRVFHVRERVCAVVLFFLCIAAVLLIGGFAAARLLREAQELVARLLADVRSPSSALSDAIDALRLPEGEDGEAFRAHLKAMVNDLAKNLLGSLAARLPQWAAKLASGIPAAILFAVVTVLAGIRFCLGGVAFPAFLPERVRSALFARKPAFAAFARRYLRAYFLLFSITFLQLLVGFLILGLDFAVLPALLIAAVDILPVLGVGTVLLPWAAVELLCRRFYLGFGLIILWFAITVARQIAEPHLIGKSLGVSPLLSLAASYIGWRLAGVTGLLLGPISAFAIQAAAFRKEPTK